MRTYVWVAGLTLGLAWAGSVQAQGLGFTPHFSITPNIAANQPMSYVNANAPIGANLYNPTNNGSAFPVRLGQMFFSPSRTNTISNSITRGTSTFPTPAQMQAAAPLWFSRFQMYRAPCIQP